MSHILTPRFETAGPWTCVGVSTLVDMSGQPSVQIGELWDLYGKCGPIPNAVEPWTCLGVEDYPEDFKARRKWFYTATAVVTSTDKIPSGCVVKTIPRHDYAIFTHRGPLPVKLSETFDHIYRTWLPNSGFQVAAAFDFERYDSRFKGINDEGSLIEIWLPIRPITSAQPTRSGS